MSTKCTICNQEIKELFLGKIKGTFLKKPGSSKHSSICFTCQRKFQSKEELLKQIK